MNRIRKYILSKTYQPLVAGYLSSTRTYRYGGISLKIPKEVFHPAFFRSTKILLKYISSLPLKDKTFLELGAGSGLIAFVAAQKGAQVTASDINEIAVSRLQQNGEANQIPLKIIHSDLFTDIPPQRFDIIAINPPYYKKDPVSPASHAWYCGTDGQYFVKLFEQIGAFLHAESLVLMVLSDECDLQMIRDIAADNHYRLVVLEEKNVFGENIYIFKVERGEYA